MKKRALLSVSDKSGIIEFAQELTRLGYQLISTGGTESKLKSAGLSVTNISDITGFPECLDGRVKTLHPAVHAGLLARRDNKEHMQQLSQLNFSTIDIVCVNLYPFESTIKNPDCTLEDAVENIDIGGPTMLRSAAKNYQDVLVVVDPFDYGEIIQRLSQGRDDKEFRLRLMQKVYRHTAYYDTVIADYLQKQTGEEIPQKLTLAFEKVSQLRYGENPHQSAAFYKSTTSTKSCLPQAEQLQGKELSYNNINDAYGAIELIKEFDTPAAVAIKHANPCGVALGENTFEAYKKAYECDPESIFGGIVAFNRPVDQQTAQEMVKIFLEIVIAPSYSAQALEVFKQKPNLRVLRLEGLDKSTQDGYMCKFINGGMLYQSKDTTLASKLEVVTKKTPTDSQMQQMLFAYKVVKHVKSNAIVLCKDFAAVGIGAGQTNRIWAANQAAEHAAERSKGAVAASDAFFPFDDCVTALASAGIECIIQPGGSIRDQDSIKACDEKGIAMVFTGNRHFKH